MLNAKKGDKIIVKVFTGMKAGVFTVDSADKKTVTVQAKNGKELVFDRKTGRQINTPEGKEKYANTAIDDDGSYVAPSTRGAARKKATKKSAVKSKSTPVEEDEEEIEEEEDEEPVKPVKKPAKKAAPAKKPAKKVVEEDDDDDFEEVDE